MYTKDKNHRITLRLNEDQFEFVKMNAESLGVSPSDFLRMVINSSMFAMNHMATHDKFEEVVKDVAKETAKDLKKEGYGRENDKANQHDFV